MTDRLSSNTPLGAGKRRGREPTRRHELTLGPVGPWRATITVHAVSTNHVSGRSGPLGGDFEQ